MTDDKRTIGDMLSEYVRERAKRDATAVDEAVWALLQAGAKLGHIVIQHWPQGMGDDPTPRTTVSAIPPTVIHGNVVAGWGSRY